MFKKLLLVMLLAGIVTPSVYAQKTKNVSYHEMGDNLAPLKIVTYNKKVYSEKDFKSDNHFFLVMFNPTCSHCIEMTKLIVKNAALFGKSKVVFMSAPTMLHLIPDYEANTKVNTHPEFIVGVDSLYAIEKLYTYGSLPQINIYNNKNKLVKTFKGDVSLDSLKLYLP